MGDASSAGSGQDYFVTGGSMRHDAPCYVERQADRHLFDSLCRGDFCYVLTSRQMGKSSLMIRTASRLRQHGVNIVVVDLTAIGQNLTVEQWYDGLSLQVGRQLRIEDEIEEYWGANERLSPVQRFFAALRQVALARCRGPLVLFVDEIDVVRSLPFSTDEFFAAIRACYNLRVEEPALNRLTFCLLGVATPADLIRDPRTTPFNIGQRIELTDFTVDEAGPLAAGLRYPAGAVWQPEAALDRILYWTHGHPYLTQRLCRALMEAHTAGTRPVAIGADAERVDHLCTELFLSARACERDDNLLFVRERLVRSEGDLTSLLALYEEVLLGRPIPDDPANPLIDDLRLAGITRVAEGALQVRNRIYQQVFDREWIKANKPDASLIKPDGERIAIRGTCSIGRALNNEIVLLGDRVSRRHAQVQAQGQHEFWLMDLGAANGTFCNGQRVLRPVLLHDQDQIDIGQFRLTFRQAQRPRPSPPPDTFSDKTIVDFRL